MKTVKEKPEEYMRRRFPSADARRKADEAIDKLDVDRPMTEFIDVWYQTYQEAAGPKKK